MTDSLLIDAIRQAIAAIRPDLFFSDRNRIARAALKAVEASGHAIVPMEATDEMIGEGGLARLRHDGTPRDAPVASIYAAMLAARPKVLE